LTQAYKLDIIFYFIIKSASDQNCIESKSNQIESQGAGCFIVSLFDSMGDLGKSFFQEELVNHLHHPPFPNLQYQKIGRLVDLPAPLRANNSPKKWISTCFLTLKEVRAEYYYFFVSNFLLCLQICAELAWNGIILWRTPARTEFFLSFRLSCTCYTCNYAYSAIPCVRRILLKLLRIEVETNHIIMTMGIHSIKPPWVPICLIQTYRTKYRYWYA
jgi:hypothetical protein